MYLQRGKPFCTLMEEDFRLCDLHTVTRGDLPARLDWSIIGWTILLRALMNLEKTKIIKWLRVSFSCKRNSITAIVQSVQ